MRFLRTSQLLIVALTFFAAAALSQTNAGVVSFPNSGSKAAQAPFLQGLAQLHNFEYEFAAKDFREAEKMDPDFAAPKHWGEAMTFNHPVWNQQNRTAALAALNQLGSTPEARLAKAPTEREKDYLRSLDILYGEGPKPTRDQRYADAIAQLHTKHPDDIDAAAFDALALLGTGEGVRDERAYMKAAAILVPLFYQHPDHPGIAHYLIHSSDDPYPRTACATRCTCLLQNRPPDAGHAQHMTSHIFWPLECGTMLRHTNEAAMRVVNEQRSASWKDDSSLRPLQLLARIRISGNRPDRKGEASRRRLPRRGIAGGNGRSR